MRKHLGVLIGTAISLGVVAGLAKLNLVMFPWPDFDWRSSQGWGDAIAAAPMTVQAMIAGGWAVAALTGGLIGARIADWPAAGWIICVSVALTGAATVLFVPQPLWMQITAVVAPLFAGLIVAGAN